MFDFIVRNIFKLFARIFYRYKVLNKHNFPKKKVGALVVANHISYLDSFLIAGWTPRMVRFVLLKQIYEGKLHWLFKGVRIVPVTPSISKARLDEFNNRCRKLIDEGEIVYIYAEGEMTRVNYLLPFKKGLEYIAEGQNINVVPIHYDNTTGSPKTYIPGAGRAYGFNFKTLQRKIIVNVGSPVSQPVTAFKARQLMLGLSVESFYHRIKKTKKLESLVSNLMKKNKMNRANRGEVMRLMNSIPVEYHDLYKYTLLAFNQVLKQENLPRIELKESSPPLEILYNYLPLIAMGKKVPLELGCWRLKESGVLVSMNAHDLIAKDVTGARIRQYCCKKGSVGRPLPGVAVKAVDKNDFSCELQEDQEGLLFVKGYVVDCNPLIDKSSLIDGWYNTNVLGFVDFDGFIFLKE